MSKRWRGKRRSRGIPPRPVFLIVCEGERTEPNYFRRFGRGNVQVRVVGGQGAPVNVVRQAVRMKRKKDYDQVWVVFDKDEIPANAFNNAVFEAQNQGIRVAYSNQAFELWYVLHFDYLDTSLGRRDYIAKLERRLGRPYRKNSTTLFDELLDKQPIALANAQRLEAKKACQSSKPADNDPCTLVHHLVEELNKY